MFVTPWRASREFFVCPNYFRIETCDNEIEKFERLSDVTPGQTRGLSQLVSRPEKS